MATTDNSMEEALKERGHYLYVYWMRERMSKRRNKDGSPAYKDFLKKLNKWNQQQLRNKIK